MDESITTEMDRRRLWLSHALVAVITIVVMVVLLALQPWSSEAVAAVQSFRMSISSSITEGNRLSEVAQEVAYIVPDRGLITTNVGSEKLEIIAIGEDIYATDKGLTAGVTSIAVWMSLEAIIPGKEHTETTLGQLTDVEELAIERIGGVTCRHYRGRMDLTGAIEEQIAGLDPDDPNYEYMLEMLDAEIAMMQQIVTNIEVWAGRDDGFVRQVKYEAEMPTGESTSTLMQYYDINRVIEIEPPLDSSGRLLPGWYKAG